MTPQPSEQKGESDRRRSQSRALLILIGLVVALVLLALAVVPLVLGFFMISSSEVWPAGSPEPKVVPALQPTIAVATPDVGTPGLGAPQTNGAMPEAVQNHSPSSL